jgi:signal peptidase I
MKKAKTTSNSSPAKKKKSPAPQGGLGGPGPDAPGLSGSGASRGSDRDDGGPGQGQKKGSKAQNRKAKGNGGEVDAKKDDGRDGEPMTLQSHLFEYGKAVLLAVILALLIRSFVVQAFHIPSGSMIPTFLEGDRVLVSKFSYGVRNPFTNSVIFDTGEPRRGDVVIFKYPSDPKMDFVKRVVGLPGEVVEIKEGKVYIDGALTDDPYGHYDGSPYTPSRNFGPVTVPEGQYFMMGDNRDFSNDSRGWGCVDSSLLRGKAWRLYWSWDSEDKLPLWKRLRFSRLGHKIT